MGDSWVEGGYVWNFLFSLLLGIGIKKIQQKIKTGKVCLLFSGVCCSSSLHNATPDIERRKVLFTLTLNVWVSVRIKESE